MAIVATPGAANANSYVTTTEAEQFFDSHIGSSDWFESTEQEQSLIQACWLLDQLDYIGDRSATTQALEWPRVINDFYELNHDAFPFTSTEIPQRLKYAQCEIALWLVQTGGTVAEGAVSELQIGSAVTAKFATGGSTSSASLDVSDLPLPAVRFLKGLRLYPVLA